MRKEGSEAVKTVLETNVEGIRGRPKEKWLNVIDCDMRTTGVYVNDVDVIK